MAKKRRGRSASFMRSINPYLKKRKVNKVGSVRYGMAKRRRSVSRRRSRSSSSRGVMGAILGVVGGVLGFAILDTFIHPFLGKFLPAVGIALAEVGMGAWLSTKGGWKRGLGLAMMIIPAFALVQTFVTPAFSGILPAITA